MKFMLARTVLGVDIVAGVARSTCCRNRWVDRQIELRIHRCYLTIPSPKLSHVHPKVQEPTRRVSISAGIEIVMAWYRVGERRKQA